MKRIIAIFLVSSIFILSLTGCGKKKIYSTYLSMMEDIHMNNFDVEVIEKDDETSSAVIRNKVTGEYFLCIGGLYGMSMTPISINETREEHKKIIVQAGGIEKELEEVIIYKEK